MIPVIALVGRPNVGKSTLFNRLTKSRDALVANFPGLTRDRKYGEAEFAGHRFMLIDTGGITGEEEGIDEAMAAQSLQAIDEADAVLFVVDCRDGLTATDRQLAAHLREQQRKVFLVANKVDGINPDVAIAEFFELGYEQIFPITATHGRGVKSLMEEVLASYPPNIEDGASGDIDEDAPRATRIAIIGRPNVGKSTLVNRMLGEDRVVVFDLPGTTRDSIYIDYERDGKPYTIIDTAGIRRRKNVKLTVEKFSIVKTLQAIDDANVVVLLMDAQEGLVEQDMHLMGSVVEAGRALVLVINKWDGLDSDKKEWMKTELNRRLRFVDFADVHFISALHGSGVGKLYGSIEKAFAAATDKLSTNHLTRILEDATADHQPPLVRGRRIKLRYAHAGGKNPPIIVIHGNQTSEVPSHYTRYLEKTFRKALDLHGTPVRIEYRTSDNPFAGRKNKLTNRQVAKKRRMMKHVKKKK
ncbi:MAG: ribosome biogenesis GTPase Der [Porticoccaceae bacterium]|nr:ribosome biogenesis GTPase Der [Pseudomonadales bacterium]MCP5173096.1 ribosome biogenesis GTPase Der [Pseudomonadales bacterium]